MRVEITVGTGFDSVGNAVLFREEKTDHVVAQAAGLFGGVTVTDGQGAWVDPAGKLVKEPTLTLTVFTSDPDAPAKAGQLAEIAREAFEQTAVVLNVSPSKSQFITLNDAVSVG